jgi:hypothetical protein
MHNCGLPLIAPKVAPLLDPAFRPAVLVNQQFHKAARTSDRSAAIHIALAQADGSVSHYDAVIFLENHFGAADNFSYLERLVKFLLWSRGGWRIYFDGPQSLGEKLARHFRETPTGKFDSHVIGERIYDRPIEVVITRDLPPERATTKPLGRHWNGCRIGFDLGGSDRKVAAVIDGQVVFSEETVWDPYFQSDPQYHFDGIVDSLKKAAAHLPRVDAIGGSAAGVYVNNRVKAASLFAGGVSADGKILWLSGRYHNEVYAIDTADGSLRARIKVGKGPHGFLQCQRTGRGFDSLIAVKPAQNCIAAKATDTAAKLVNIFN